MSSSMGRMVWPSALDLIKNMVLGSPWLLYHCQYGSVLNENKVNPREHCALLEREHGRGLAKAKLYDDMILIMQYILYYIFHDIYFVGSFLGKPE